MRALAPEVRIYRFRAPRRSETAGKAVPHRLKPSTMQADYGTAEPNPCPSCKVFFRSLKAVPFKLICLAQMSTC
jgi:hypothetical protein